MINPETHPTGPDPNEAADNTTPATPIPKLTNAPLQSLSRPPLTDSICFKFSSFINNNIKKNPTLLWLFGCRLFMYTKGIH